MVQPGTSRLLLLSITALLCITAREADEVLADERPLAAPSEVNDAADAQVSKMIRVVIPAVDGSVKWDDVADSLGEALKLEPELIKKSLPAGQLDLRSDLVLLTLMGINLAAGDVLSFDLVRDSNQQLALSVECDRSLLTSGAEKIPAEPVTIDVDSDWMKRSADRPLVICIHGLQGEASAFDSMRAAMRARGYGTAAISYDDQQSIAVSAEQVSKFTAKWFAGRGRTPDVVLVGHSMGGLVAREWTENPTLPSNDIVSLITIGTPHHGSAWATMPPLLDLFTVGEFSANDVLDVILHTPSVPGLRDLAPDSKFLRELSSRPHRPGVSITSIVGTGSPVPAARVREIQRLFKQLERRDGFVRLIRPRIKPLIDGFDELARGRGDGVVAVNSARMEGCDDVVKVDLSHFELVKPIPGRGSQPVWEAVIERLERIPHRP